MKKNFRKKLKETKGITLIALVITIIVLLILAGVALSSVLSQDGIFSRAEQATDKYGQAKARETLELALGEAQMQKYEQGLTDEQLDNKINEIGELLPKEKPDPNLQNVIVDGHIFEIDRSVPKIVDYIGPADGVVITAQITQNGNWQNPVATVKGTIKTYSGGNIINSTATVVSGNANVADFPTNGGDYTIENITEDTDIKITAKDNKDKSNEKVIKVLLVRDNTPPTLSNAKAEADRMKIKISVIATDTESGVSQINYKITPNTVDTTTPAEGTLQSGKEKEIITTAEGEYTVTFTATDNAGNTTDPGVTAKATTIDGITVAEAKQITQETIREYIGTKVIDYNPTAGGVYRVFYYDEETTDYPKGYFGDGDGTGPRAGTVYLKRDYISNDTSLSSYTSHTSSDSGAIMKRMNPKWRDYPNANENTIDITNEHCVAWLCDPAEWTNYKTTNSSFAIGSPSVEMYMKAFNLWKTGNPNSTTLINKIGNINGYSVGARNDYKWNDSTEYFTGYNSIEPGPNNIFMTSGNNDWWLASPSACDNYVVLYVVGIRAQVSGDSHKSYGLCPIVPLDL